MNFQRSDKAKEKDFEFLGLQTGKINVWEANGQ